MSKTTGLIQKLNTPLSKSFLVTAFNVKHLFAMWCCDFDKSLIAISTKSFSTHITMQHQGFSGFLKVPLFKSSRNLVWNLVNVYNIFRNLVSSDNYAKVELSVIYLSCLTNFHTLIEHMRVINTDEKSHLLTVYMLKSSALRAKAQEAEP